MFPPNITDFLSVNNQSELSIFLYFHTFYSVAFLLQFFKHFMHNHAILHKIIEHMIREHFIIMNKRSIIPQ